MAKEQNLDEKLAREDVRWLTRRVRELKAELVLARMHRGD